MKKLTLNFNNNLIPVIIQDYTSKEILMLGYMNKTALEKTLKTRYVWFFSRSRNRLWQKGEKSGNKLKLVAIYSDCDKDTILIYAKPMGAVCHTGEETCFKQKYFSLGKLAKIIDSRKNESIKKSYSARLLSGTIDKICLKIGEESGEVIRAVMKETKQRVIEETADLIYHLLVLLRKCEIDFSSVIAELEKRNN